ncbi:MAG TPA: hypothetical protein VM120_19325 [Bryobacteraceae bacterium]|nr:hypothetical protein [Bryobacteraceae bacterium]
MYDQIVDKKGTTMIDLKDKQKIARENGKKSQGPITPEGKHRSSQNSITHGLASKCVVLSNESEDLYTALLTSYQTEWQPATTSEQHLVTQMVNSYWRLRRIWTMETALFDSEMFDQKKAFEAAWSYHHPAMRLVDSLVTIRTNTPTTLDTLSRYEVRYQRAYNNSMNQLRKLRRDRNAPVVEFTAPTRPDRIPPDPQQPVAELTPATNWLTRLLAIVLAILNSVRFPKKKRNQPRNTPRRANEPITILELPVFNFHLPEIFAWLSILTKPGAGPAQPETPHAA